MRATLFAGCLAGSLYCLFVTGNTEVGYIILGVGFFIWLYGAFRALLGHS